MEQLLIRLMDWAKNDQFVLIGHFILFLVCLQIAIKVNKKKEDDWNQDGYYFFVFKSRRNVEIFGATLFLFFWIELIYWIVS